jgi:Family of unknown function (DUF5681)
MTDTRNTDGTFPKGQSGNPSGRAKMPSAVREMLTAKAQEAVQIITKHLDDTDPRVALRAAEMLLDRAYGKPQTASETIELSDIGDTSTADGLLQLHSAMVAAVTVGKIHLSEAREFSALLESQRRLVETVDLEARLSKLEQQQVKL